MGQVVTKFTVIVFLAVFWTVVYTLFVFAGQALTVPSVISNADMTSLQNQALNADITKPNPMFFMFEVMFFQVDSSYGIPMIVSLMLLMIGGMTVFVIAGILLGKLIDVN